jgi:hypothetical protein
MKEYTQQQSLSQHYRSKKIFLAAFLYIAFFPLQSFAATDATDVSLTVFFCNSDLVCDAEENSDSCPSDCVATSTPPTSTTTTQSTGGGGSGGGVGFGPMPYWPQGEPTEPPGGVTTVISPELSDDSGGAVSSDPLWNTIDPFWSSSFSVSVDEIHDDIYFSWLPGSYVRILRSEDKFPISPVEGGIVVYEGKAGVFFDTSLLPGTYYYSIFLRDSDGNYSGRQLALVQIVEKTIKITEKEQDLATKMRFLYNLLFLLLFLVALYIIWRFYVRFLD